MNRSIDDGSWGPCGPLVTAIIATYNRGYIVCEAIDSILNQTYRNTEIIVVDDGSTDDTQQKLQRYGDRIRVLSQKNSGPAAAWNAGIKAAKGKIICFLGSDDLWLPTFVERQVSVLERGGPSVPLSISNAFTRWANGRETYSFDLACLRPEAEEGLWLNAVDVLLTRFVMCGQMIAIRREALEQIGLFDGTLSYLEDYDIALRLSLEGSWGYIREPLVFYRQSTSGDSMSLQASSVDARLSELHSAYSTKGQRRHASTTSSAAVEIHGRRDSKSEARHMGGAGKDE